MTAAKDLAIAGTIRVANEFTASILDKYPAAEKAAWPQKQTEAAIIIAADDGGKSIAVALAETSILKTISSAATWDDEAAVAVARAIIQKANEFSAIAAMVEIMRETASATIGAAADLEALESAKTDLMQQASALAAQYGLT